MSITMRRNIRSRQHGDRIRVDTGFAVDIHQMSSRARRILEPEEQMPNRNNGTQEAGTHCTVTPTSLPAWPLRPTAVTHVPGQDYAWQCDYSNSCSRTATPFLALPHKNLWKGMTHSRQVVSVLKLHAVKTYGRVEVCIPVAPCFLILGISCG
jgi:hypothetical protein